MSPHLQAALIKDFPGILHADQDGQGHLFIECRDGWEPVLRQAIAQIAILGFPVRVSRIREKYGSLRIEAMPEGDRQADPVARERALDAIVLLAEERSVQICEVCGKPGSEAVSTGGWRLTRCDEHFQVAGGSLLRRVGSGIDL